MEKSTQKEQTSIPEKPKCGIVMPISAIDGCPAEHWTEVLGILKEIITSAGFEVNLVSEADDSGIIQTRIIQNLYNNDIVVCDVSAKNPNVMFELGIRLAFDKPTIIIKDNVTDYSFDTSVIEHLQYPRDLRFGKIVSFKEKLKQKISATYKSSQEDPKYTTFLKHFGEYKVANLQHETVSADKYIIQAIEDLKNEFRTFKKRESDILNVNRGVLSEKIIMRKQIREFINMKNIKPINILNDNQLKEELYSFLEKFTSITRFCRSRENLEQITEDILIKII